MTHHVFVTPVAKACRWCSRWRYLWVYRPSMAVSPCKATNYDIKAAARCYFAALLTHHAYATERADSFPRNPGHPPRATHVAAASRPLFETRIPVEGGWALTHVPR